MRHAAHDGLGSKDRDQPLGGIDAVLQRDDSGAGADQRLDGLARAFDVPQLYAEQHDIDYANLGGIVGRLRRHQMGVAARALNFQTLALHGGKMRAPRDESDVGARLGQRRTKTTSDAAGADNRNTHGVSSDWLERVGWVAEAQRAKAEAIPINLRLGKVMGFEELNPSYALACRAAYAGFP